MVDQVEGATASMQDVLECLRKEPGPECARFAVILERNIRNVDLLREALSTHQSGAARSMEDWAKYMADYYMEATVLGRRP